MSPPRKRSNYCSIRTGLSESRSCRFSEEGQSRDFNSGTAAGRTRSQSSYTMQYMRAEIQDRLCYCLLGPSSLGCVFGKQAGMLVPRGQWTGELDMVCCPLPGTGMQPPSATSGNSFLSSEEGNVVICHTQGLGPHVGSWEDV